MDENALRKDLYKDEEQWLWDWPFENKELLKDPKLIRIINKKELLNKINHLHFIGELFQLFFQDIKNQNRILFQAKIKSCSETAITCVCADKSFHDINTRDFQMTHLAIDDGKKLILMMAFLISKKNNFLTIHLPDIGYEINQRQVKRYSCYNVNVSLKQDGLEYHGMLLDFNSLDCHIQLKPISIFLLKKDLPINTSFYRDNQLLYSTNCFLTRENDHLQAKELVLNFIHAMKPIMSKEHHIRNPRLNLCPSPSITYLHPIINKQFQLEIKNISSSGFCAYENESESVLLEGLFISDLLINFSDLITLKCSARVIYCKTEEKIGIKCGFSILDLNQKNYNSLFKILDHSLDSNIYFNNKIDMDSIWNLFFDINFIYSKKYKHIKSMRRQIKETYRNLYQENPEIANHIVYQKNGLLYGHLSMVRAYNKTWLIHHHAAKRVDNKPIGFILVKHILHYFLDMHRLPSLNTNYLMSYFRPDNRFPENVFGGFCRRQADFKVCSMDLFCYFEKIKPTIYTNLSAEWSLRSATSIDLNLLSDFYQKKSGGLFLEAIGLEENNFSYQSIETLYQNYGFLRKLKIYTLSFAEEPYAILILEKSDSGLNLSDLLNNIKVIVLKPEYLSWKILSNVLLKLINKYQMRQVPVLIYPLDYIIMEGIPVEKQYRIWICQASHFHRLAEHLQDRYRNNYWN